LVGAACWSECDDTLHFIFHAQHLISQGTGIANIQRSCSKITSYQMAKLVIDEEVSAAWTRLTSDSSGVSWIACGYPEGSSTQMIFKAEGPGGLPEFCAILNDSDIVWGAFKVVGVDDRGNLVSRRPKYVFVKYVPEGVTGMKRAKAGGHKGAVKQIMNSHVDIEVESVEELSEEAIIAKLRASGGAHQPTSYEFSNYSNGGSNNSNPSTPKPATAPEPAATAEPAAAAKPAAAEPAAAEPAAAGVEVEDVSNITSAVEDVAIADNSVAAGVESAEAEPF